MSSATSGVLSGSVLRAASGTLDDLSSRVTAGNRSLGGDKHTHPGCVVFLAGILAAVYYQAVREVYIGSPPVGTTILFVMFVCSGLCLCVTMKLNDWLPESDWLPECFKSVRCLACLQKCIGLSVIVFLCSMLVQFQVYMAVIAWEYPWVCEFFTVNGDKGHVSTYQASESEGKLMLVEKTSLAKAGGFDWDIECNDSVRVLGTRGGREIISVLSHFVPFVFVGVYVVVVGSRLRLRFASMVIDYIDIQDFFLLLLDENMILGYWDKADVYTTNSSSFSLGGAVTWHLVFAWFVIASIYICVFPLIKILSAPVPVVATPRRKDVESGASVVGASREKEGGAPRSVAKTPSRNAPGRCCGLEVKHACMDRVEAAASLLIVEIPFLTIRLYCSMRMRIVASSLLIKNVFSIVYDVFRIIGYTHLKSESRFRRVCCLAEPMFDFMDRLTAFFAQESDTSRV